MTLINLGKSNGATNDPKELLLELISLGSDAENKSFRVEDFSELSFEDLREEALNLFIDWGIFAKSTAARSISATTAAAAAAAGSVSA